MTPMEPRLRDFVLFCIERRGSDWPDLYDEMAMVAGQRLFRGMGYEDLKKLGLSLCVNGLDRTLEIVRQVTASAAQN